MIRSCQIPSVLRRICTDNVIQTALLVTTDGELLGSTATTFLSPDGTTKESIESLGTLIADIAVDYSKLGEEYANLDPGNSNNNIPTAPNNNNNNNTVTNTATNSNANAITNTNTIATNNAGTGGASVSSASANSASSQGVTNNNTTSQSLSTSRKSHLQCLLLELELGLVAVSACIGVDCMVIAIAAPSAPLGAIRARLRAITAHVQEALSPLAMTEGSSRSSYR